MKKILSVYSLYYEDIVTRMTKLAYKEFPKKYKSKWLEMMKKKLGLVGDDRNDEQLIIELLSWMHKNKADYTNTFCFLMNEYKCKKEVYSEKQFILWKKKC